MIDREALIKRHCPVLTEIDTHSPLTVGNGELAFTADVTGFQTLYDEYEIFPLCTMSQWGWHTSPAALEYSLDDVVMTRYSHKGKEFNYASLPQPGNENIYHLLRHNPHRLNLARISLLWEGNKIKSTDLFSIYQMLDLYSGIISSEFTLFNNIIQIQTCCAKNSNVLGFSITAPARCTCRLSVCISFPYGSYLKNASDWESPSLHTTDISSLNNGDYMINRCLDNDKYNVLICGVEYLKNIGEHMFEFTGNSFTVSFSENTPEKHSFEQVEIDSIKSWYYFWNKGGAVDFSAAKDPRAHELERRVILSQYLTAVQCSGSLPPQETGLSCNSWYGKFHLEMHIIHAGWFPLWGHSDFLSKSLPWYKSVLCKAKENAKRNNFPGVRWPKMAGPEGYDSPSWIATLLIWQQPHILYMLELIRCSLPENKQKAFIDEYSEVVSETAKFMHSFMQKNKHTGFYQLTPPLIPAQEEHAPDDVTDPVFELSYWRFGLEIAEKWESAADSSGAKPAQCYESNNTKLNNLPVIDGLYPAHGNCPDTFGAFNKDHPSMLYAYGFIPNDEVDTSVMSATVDKVLECWDMNSLWGWDFALIAMTLTRLGRPEAAIDVLLMDTSKNKYTKSGNNFQQGRDDLPLYLPGNGSLLLALAMMLEGYGETSGTVGFPNNGMWDGIITEGISPLPY